MAAGGAGRFAGCGAPGPGPGGLPGAGGGFVLNLPGAPALAAPASTVEVAMATASISLHEVGRTFVATRALAGVDLDLEPGVTGLLGPNGAWINAAAPAGHRAAAQPRTGARAGPGPAGAGRTHRHPPPARLPAARGRLPARLHRLRVRGLHRAAQGVDPAGRPARGSVPRARPGGAVRPRREADPGHVRRPAPAGRAGAGAARLAAGADPGRADHRRRPGTAGGPADRARGDRAHVDRGAVHRPDRGRCGPVPSA